ncbi:MAG: hypothetical protein ACI8UO_004437 [Verrucomicrobiales bacterium]|jgi:hypothetical protein
MKTVVLPSSPPFFGWKSPCFALAAISVVSSCWAQDDFSLSASLQVDAPETLLFEGDSAEAELEVIAHPVSSRTWSGIKVRVITAKLDGEKLISASPVTVRLKRPGSEQWMIVSTNKWYTASYLGLKAEARKLGVKLTFKRASDDPIEFIAEVDSSQAELAQTAPLEVRCSALRVLDLRDPSDEDDDIEIDNEDTAWITHIEDETTVTQLMPRLSAKILGLPEDTTVSWQFENAYIRRKGLDDRRFPSGDEDWREVPGDKAWDLHGEFGKEFFGGDGQLRYRVTDADGKKIHEGERAFGIRSKNPSDSAALKIIRQERGKYWFAEAVSQHESRQGRQVFNQFNTLGRVVNQPNFGAPDAWGLFQIDSARGEEVSTMEAWDWRSNVQAGIKEFQTAERDTAKYLEALKRTYPDQYELPPSHLTPPGCKTQLTFEEASIIQLYNGAAIVKKLKTKWDTLSYYRGAFQFYPGNPSGKRWKFIPNKMNYLITVLKNELEGGMKTE